VLFSAVYKEFLPHTVSFFRKQTTPFSITLSTPTCDLINIYTLSLPQGRGVRDVVILLIGATPPLSSAPRMIILKLTTTRNDIATVRLTDLSANCAATCSYQNLWRIKRPWCRLKNQFT
jgi:hypothetical protein